MTKTALIADDDSATRGMVSRVLRLMDWVVIEVQDGGTAVERLQSQQIDLVILDLHMPQLSGFEVLRVIRGSADYSDVPVVIMTGTSDAETSHELMALGITDFFVKPLKLDFARDRLARIDRLVCSTLRPRRTAKRHTSDNKGLVIVVDGDAEYRSFVSKVLMHKYQVAEATSAVVALRLAMTTPADIFLIGADVGLMTPDFLARKIRDRRDLEQARLVHVGPASDVDEALFDAVMPRTFVPGEFSEHFNRLFGRSFTDDADELAEVRHTVESATEQVVGMMAATSVTFARTVASDLSAGQMRASVDVQLTSQRVEFRLVLRATGGDASVVAAHMLGLPEPEPEDALATLGEMTNVIAGRIKTAVTGKGQQASFSLPETTADAPAEEPDERDVVYAFTPADDGFRLFLALQLLPRADHTPALREPEQAVASAG